jgi:hypothetical protein
MRSVNAKVERRRQRHRGEYEEGDDIGHRRSEEAEPQEFEVPSHSLRAMRLAVSLHTYL